MALCILGIDYFRRGCFKDLEGHRWTFGIAAVETEEIRELVPGASRDPSAVGLLRVKEQQVPIATTTVHCQKYCPSWDCVTPIHEMIRDLGNLGVVSKTHSAFSSLCGLFMSLREEWRLTVE